MNHHLVAAAGLGLGLSITAAACTSGHSSAGGGAAATTTTAAATSLGGATTTTAAGATSATTGTTATTGSTATTAAGGATATTAGGPARCLSKNLSGSLSGANGAAGSIYYSLVLTNTGSSPCLLQGYPGVSFVTGNSGQQLGAPANRIPGNAPYVLVGPGQSASATLQITEAVNFGAQCGVTPTDGLRIYPPNQTAAIFVPHNDQGCANPNYVTLHVGAFQSA